MASYHFTTILFVLQLPVALGHDLGLPLDEYQGFQSIQGTLCIGGNSRLITPSYLTGYRYNECCNACRASYNCAGFAVRPADGVCFAISQNCQLRDDSDWAFYRKLDDQSVQIGGRATQQPAIYTFLPEPTTQPPASLTLVSYPEFTYVGSHCQGQPLGGREFRNVEECRKFCLEQPTCFGFSLRFDGVCIAKEANCHWLSDEQWCFYMRSFKAVVVAAAPRPTENRHNDRDLLLVQFVPVGQADDQSWKVGWPTFSDFELQNGHCQGGSLMQDYLYSAENCRSACLRDPKCFGFSIRMDGLCLPKSKGCVWTTRQVDDWKFFKLKTSDSANDPWFTLAEPRDVPVIAQPSPCGGSCGSLVSYTPSPPPPPPPPSPPVFQPISGCGSSSGCGSPRPPPQPVYYPPPSPPPSPPPVYTPISGCGSSSGCGSPRPPPQPVYYPPPPPRPSPCGGGCGSPLTSPRPPTPPPPVFQPIRGCGSSSGCGGPLPSPSPPTPTLWFRPRPPPPPSPPPIYSPISGCGSSNGCGRAPPPPPPTPAPIYFNIAPSPCGGGCGSPRPPPPPPPSPPPVFQPIRGCGSSNGCGSPSPVPVYMPVESPCGSSGCGHHMPSFSPSPSPPPSPPSPLCGNGIPCRPSPALSPPSPCGSAAC